MEFSRPEYWIGKLFSSSGDLPNLGIEPRSPVLQADSLPAEPPGGGGGIKYLNKCKDMQCSWIGQFDVIKVSALCKLICSSQS